MRQQGLPLVSWLTLPAGELMVAAFMRNKPTLIYGKHFKYAELSKKKEMLGYLHKKPSKGFGGST